MDVVDVSEAQNHQNIEFLTASELVSLRKSEEEPTRCVIGEKFTTCSGSWLESKAVECALESHVHSLKKKRVARLGDLIQAEWNEDLNVSLTSKLKGKFVHHLGYAHDGKIALTPEESIFLLENGYIEIKHGEKPLSTQEAYKVMLKENLSVEKYQVYSHLSQLGFVVTPHRISIGSYEKKKLDQQSTKRKRKTISGLCDEPEKKRLTFTGAFSNEHEIVPDNSESQNNISSAVDEQNSRDSLTSSNTQFIQGIKESEIETADSDTPVSKSIERHLETVSNAVVDIINKNKILDGSEDFVTSTTVTTSVSCEESESQLQIVVPETGTLSNLNNLSSENHIQIEDKDVRHANQIDAKHDGDDLQPCTEPDSNVLPKRHEPQTNLEIPLLKNDDVMDVDSQNTEISCDSETSRDSFEIDVSNSNINSVSQDSSCALINNTEASHNLIPEANSNSDVMSCSSDSDESNVVSLNVDNENTLLQDSQDADSEVELIEVTKKEIKPLDVIDIISGESENDSDNDEEIQVVKVCPGLSTVKSPPRANNSRKLCDFFKKEERCSPVTNPKFSMPTLTVHFPDLYRKDVVCVARPPLNLLPNHVKPSKEAYILDLKQKSEQQSQPRLWNSFRDMQDYQRARRQNRNSIPSFSSFRNREPNPWVDRPPREFRQNFNPRQSDSPEASYQNRQPNPWLDGNYTNHSRDHGLNYNHRESDSPEVLANAHKSSLNSRDNNSYSFDSSRNTFPDQSRFSIPNATTMNSVVSVSNQDMNVNMVGNHLFHTAQNSNNGPASAFPPNLPTLPGLGPVDIIAEVQRTAYSVATNMLSSIFGQNFNPRSLPIPNPQTITPFSSFQTLPNNFQYNYPPRFQNSYNTQSYSSEQFSMLSNRRNYHDHYRRQHRGAPFPCHYRGLGNRQSWNEVKEAVGDRDSPVGSDIEEVPINPMEILWDPKNICPLVKPGTKYPITDVLKTLQLTHMADLLGKSKNNDKCFPTTCSLEISFDVYLPGTIYKKTCPGIPKYRIIVVKSTDPVPKYSELAFLQKKWNDGSTLQVAVVDNGDISFHSFNSISLPVIFSHE